MGYSLSRKAEEDILGIYIDGIQRFSLVQAIGPIGSSKKSLSFSPTTRESPESEPKSHPQFGCTLFERIWLFLS